MKILHVTPTFYPAHYYGGPIQSVYALCRHVSRLGGEIRVLTTNSNGPAPLDLPAEEEITLDDGVRAYYCRRSLKPDLAPTLLSRLGGYLRWADVVHITYVFSASSLAALAAARVAGRPVVWSPRGSLQPYCLQRRNGRKRAWMAACRKLRPRDLALHVTSSEEKRDVDALWPDIPSYLVANGVDVPGAVAHTRRSGALRALYLGRLHPIKALENLVAACEQSPEVELTIAGTGEADYVQSLRQCAGGSGARGRIRFAGELTGEAREEAFRQADVLVLPSYSENFGMSVAEALARGVPVIASEHTPWAKVEQMGCGLFTPNDADSLSAALRRMAGMPLGEMGERGRAWMESDYTWEAQSGHMLALYAEMRERAARN